MQFEPTSDFPPRMASGASRADPDLAREPLPLMEVRGIAHTVSYVNAEFCRLLGKSRGEILGNPFADVVPGGGACLTIIAQVYETGEGATFAHDVEAEGRSSRWRYVMWPTLDEGDSPMGVTIHLTQAVPLRLDVASVNEALLIAGLHQHELADVAQKHNSELEKEIALRTAKLRETIGELEAFSYSIVHDMRAPLRAMQGFSQILLSEYSTGLDATALSYLKRIASSASRMDSLIRDSLTYNQVLRSAVVLVPVDLDRLVRDIVGAYPGWQAPAVKIEIEGTLPLVLGLEGFLTQCISNLLANAVKFVPPGTTPRVRIWAEERPASPSQAPWSAENGEVAAGWETAGPVVRLWISDNGIGIAPKDRERIFQMFERINATEQFEGTGIGLAIVRKALDRMGGRIDLDSEMGKGSRFWFELKKASAASAEAAG